MESSGSLCEANVCVPPVPPIPPIRQTARPTAAATAGANSKERVFNLLIGPSIPTLIVPGGVRRGPLFEHEIQQEQFVDISASQVQPGAHHADFIANPFPITSNQAIHFGDEGLKIVAKTIVDHDRFLACVIQANPA